MRRFDAIDSWIIFVTVASLGSMNKAAAELGIDVSSVSRKMERLEASLGYPLFVRTNRACILTPDGDHVLKEIQPQLAHFTASVDGLSRRTDSVKGLIRLSMEPGIAKPLTRWLCEVQDKIFTSPIRSISGPCAPASAHQPNTFEPAIPSERLPTSSITA